MHRLGAVVIAACMAAGLLTSCRDRSAGVTSETPAPPDLSQCTRIEVRIEPSALEALVGPYSGVRSVLSDEERSHIESLETLVIDDPQYIHTLALDVVSVPYHGPYKGSIAAMPVYHVSGWRDGECLATFIVKGPVLLTEDHVFGNKRAVSLTPQLEHFRKRLKCAENLRLLGTSTLAKYAETYRTCPAAPQWCDSVAQQGRTHSEHLICPSAPEGRCHYAMNPNCEPNSPGDMVLLFETKAGWNQHGGPELFTFDRHDPKGGCILLNDGTVKFVRTEDELHALRWD